MCIRDRDNPGNDQRQAGPAGQIDCFGNALVVVNPPEEEQVASRAGGEGKLLHRDPVINGGACLLYTSRCV